MSKSKLHNFSSSPARVFYFLWGSLIFPFFLHSQVPTTSDCAGAFIVCNLTYNQPLSFIGSGNYPNEINPNITCFNGGEINSSWYLINVQSNGLLGFNIVPNCEATDYDWAVFNLTNNTCADIFTVPGLQVGCNYSGSTFPTPVTGANGGPNPQDGPLIPVSANQVYALIVSNFSDNQCGFVLDFSLSTAQIIDNEPPSLRPNIPSLQCASNSIPISLSEFVRCNSIGPANFIVQRPDGGNVPVNLVSGINCLNGGQFEKDFTIVLGESLNQGGSYTLKMFGPVMDNCGNFNPDTQMVSFVVNTFTASLSSTLANCQTNNGSISITISGGTPPYIYTIAPPNFTNSSGNNNFVINGMSIGWKYINIVDFQGCSTRDSIRVFDTNNFDFQTFIISDTCSAGVGSVVILPSGGTPPYNFIWPLGTTTLPPPANNTATNLQTGNYVFSVLDNGGCSLTDTLFVEDYRFNLDANFTFSLDAEFPTERPVDFVNLSQGASSYLWLFGDGGSSTLTNPSHVFLGSGSWPVSLVAFNNEGCTDTARIIIELPFLLNYFVPNAFTPNGDVFNEEFRVVVNGIRDSTFQLTIFDRWGSEVFQTNNKFEGWNGAKDNEGNKLPTGIYGYRVYFRDQSGRQHTKYGRVMLVGGREKSN